MTDSESAYLPPCTSPHPSSSSSLTHIFLSPGYTVPATPSVSPLSPLHIENTLISPTPMSLTVPSPSSVLGMVQPTSPQHQSAAARSEASQMQALFTATLTSHPMHTNTHLPANGSSQPLIQVIVTGAEKQIIMFLLKGCALTLSYCVLKFTFFLLCSYIFNF